MYNRPRRYQHRRQVSVLEYLMPYLIIICLAIILVLIFNLWRAISTPDFKEDAYMHVVDGSVQMKAWGQILFLICLLTLLLWGVMS